MRAFAQYAQRCCMNTYMFAHAQRRVLVFTKQTLRLVVAGTCGHVSACSLLGGCARVLLSMWVHACKRWVLITFGDTCVPACHCICGYTLTIPLPHTLSYYLQTLHSPCPLFKATTIGGGLPPPDHGRAAATPKIGARQRRLCLCMFDVIFVTHISITTIPTPPVWTPSWYALIPDLLSVKKTTSQNLWPRIN